MFIDYKEARIRSQQQTTRDAQARQTMHACSLLLGAPKSQGPPRLALIVTKPLNI